MKRIDFRIILGSMLILAGGLGILQAFGWLEDASDVFWGAMFLLAGAAFLVVFAGGQWWGVIPGLVLGGIGVLILLPESLDDFSGSVFLAAIGLSFWVVYLAGRERWWAIIPGGVLLTLSIVAGLPDGVDAMFSGGIFFIGLAFTFLLVALLTGMTWAYWPAGALAVLGVLLFIPSQIYLATYLGAGALILAGGFMIWRSFRSIE